MKLNIIVMSIALLIICICIGPSTADPSNTTVLVSNASNTLGVAVIQDMNQTIYATTIPTIKTPNTDAFSGSSYSGANATATISVPIPRYEKPIVHITSPKTYYSSPPSGSHEIFKAPSGLTISSYKQNTIIDKNNLTSTQKKLTTSLLLVSDPSVQVVLPNNNDIQLSLITKTVPKSVETQGFSSIERPSVSGLLVYVYISMNPGYSTHSIDPYVAEVTDRDEENSLAVAWVDNNNLVSVASLKGVRSIEEVLPPVVNIGSVTTQGDTIHKTANVRSTYGYTGTGMKIGIISDGVNHISSSVASGDLPNTVYVLSDTVGGDEGTAMLEIVHDMVPDAELYFHDCGTNKVAFNAAIDELKANGCTIICDDIGWLTEPFFEDGIIASHVSSLVTNPNDPIIYVSSAGNAAEEHYQGDFFPIGGTNLTDFSRGADPTYKSLYVNLPAYSTVRIFLEWNDQFGHSANDYDLYLSQSTYGDLGYSINVQNGAGYDPLEFITYTNPSSSTILAQIDVNKYRGVGKTLELYIYTYGAQLYLNNIVTSDSIFGHPAVPEVIAVSAVSASFPSTIEYYSSRGPVTISYPAAVSRSKPDISGVDCVAVTGVGGFGSPFCGTSASAPHIASIAAQIWGAHPSLTPAQVRNVMYTTATDLGIGGWDTTFGYGRADALAMADITAVPVSNFTATPLSGNAPLSVQFNDTSTMNPTTWNWSFTNVTGNNTPVWFSTVQNPAHTFGVGNYSIVLNASNSAGYNLSTQLTFINVTATTIAPVASFTADVTGGTAPLVVTFTDTSSNTPTVWNWSFTNVTGNNTQVWFSTVQNPAHSFGVGNYSIVLNASNTAGYNLSTQVTFINVTATTIAPVASFTADVTSGTAPLAVTFTDTSSNTPTAWNWSFTNVTGNNTLVWWSTDQSPTTTFGVGNFSIVLNASNSAGYNLSTQVTFINVTTATIEPVTNFTGTPTTGDAPLTVIFTDTSLNTPMSWNWTFGDDSLENHTQQNPIHMYTRIGVYTVSLNATNTWGSNTKTIANYITVPGAPVAPVANFTGTPTTGDAPLTVIFTDTSTGLGITAWNWSFGDGTWENRTSSTNQVHVYGAGTWYPILTVTNSVGSNTTLITPARTITVTATPPVASFTPNTTSGTAPLAVLFTDASSHTPTAWNWSFMNVTGDNTQVWFSKVQDPAYTFGVGNYSIVLNASNSAGYNLSTQVTFINVSAPTLPPVASFTADVTSGTAPLAVNFTDNSTNIPTTWNWSFTNVTGNGTQLWWSTDQNPVKTFGVGNYTIVLNASNSAGYNLSTQVTFINVTSVPATSLKTKVGVFLNGGWWLDANGDGIWDTGDEYHMFGSPGVQAVTGDWNRDGKDEIGVFLNGGWWLDANGSGAWDTGDEYHMFGSPGVQAVTGDWNLVP